MIGYGHQLNDLESRALYTHCYRQALNLAIQVVVKSVKVMEDIQDMVHKITTLIRKSSKCDIIFDKIKYEVAGGSM